MPRYKLFHNNERAYIFYASMDVGHCRSNKLEQLKKGGEKLQN